MGVLTIEYLQPTVYAENKRLKEEIAQLREKREGSDEGVVATLRTQIQELEAEKLRMAAVAEEDLSNTEVGGV